MIVKINMEKRAAEILKAKPLISGRRLREILRSEGYIALSLDVDPIYLQHRKTLGNHGKKED
jgi:hypothetical protein